MAIQVTEAAARKIVEGTIREGVPGGGLRLGVKGGGCSGLNYIIRFEAQQKPGDKVVEAHGAKVFVDFKSLLYLKGTTLDWSGDLMQQGFTFQNPNAKKTCSCGISFTV
ncbi:MAG: iron-sulfur cluster assembly accessory protein [Acidobacteriota bacterium]